jgi:hypothetical protein
LISRRLHRAAAIFLSISLSFFLPSFFARAGPPLRPRATAAGSFPANPSAARPSYVPHHALSYARALDALAASIRDAHALAEMLEYAAALLRGKTPDTDGPPLDFVPGGARVLAVLGRLDRALAGAERVWGRLDPFLREGLEPPGELLEEAGCA